MLYVEIRKVIVRIATYSYCFCKVNIIIVEIRKVIVRIATKLPLIVQWFKSLINVEIRKVIVRIATHRAKRITPLAQECWNQKGNCKNCDFTWPIGSPLRPKSWNQKGNCKNCDYRLDVKIIMALSVEIRKVIVRIATRIQAHLMMCLQVSLKSER